MILQNEEAVKKELSLREPRGVYLLFGDEPALLSLYRKKLISRLCNDGADPDRFDGKRLDLPALADAVSLLSMFGGRRVTEVADLAPEQLSEPDCKALCALLGEIPPDSTLLLVCEADSLDLKKGKNAKRLHAAADAAGAVLTLNRRTSAELRATLRNRCQKKGCELSSDEANLLIERCGDDLAALLNECDKLCAYAQGRPITAAMIRTLCTGTISADLYAVAKLMLRRRPQPVLDEIDALLRSRQPAALILANLGGAFSDLARGCAARSAGKNGADLAADFSYRFAWKAANALRDSNGLDAKRVQRVCEILCEAETTLKSASCDERVLLETAVVRSMLALRGEPC